MRRLRWLGLAALLLAAAALLLALGEREPPRAARAPVRYPEWYSTEQWKRREARETLALPRAASPAPTAAAAAPAEPPPKRDPLLVALPAKPDAPVVVFEANALRHSALGEKFLACIDAEKPGEFEKVREAIGIDPRKDIDRVAYTDDAVVVSGFFQGLHLEKEFPEGAEAYGDAGRLYHQGTASWLATWRDQILVLGRSRDAVQRSIDQLEGRAPVPPSGIAEDQSYGEVYGVIPGAAAKRLLGVDERGIGQRLAQLAERIELHVDAMQDVAAVVQVQGSDAQGVSDLARSMGAALAVARIKAQAEGNEKIADLLESAEVRQPGGGLLTVRFAVTADQLDSWFDGCGRRAAGESEATPGR